MTCTDCRYCFEDIIDNTAGAAMKVGFVCYNKLEPKVLTEDVIQHHWCEKFVKRTGGTNARKFWLYHYRRQVEKVCFD